MRVLFQMKRCPGAILNKARGIRQGYLCEWPTSQIVSMLTGLFWEVEHSAIYKPTPSLKGIARSLEMQQRTRDVLRALRSFEEEFERLAVRERVTSEELSLIHI